MNLLYHLILLIAFFVLFFEIGHAKKKCNLLKYLIIKRKRVFNLLLKNVKI